MDLSTTRDHDLYQLWAQSMTELQKRGMLANGSPLGWAAEQLVCDRLRLDPTPVNTHYRDAIGRQKPERYQIKARTRNRRAPNVNGLQDVPGRHFDFLVVVIFEEDHRSVHRAFKIPHSAVEAVAKPSSRNGYGFPLNADIVARNGVEDITGWLA